MGAVVLLGAYGLLLVLAFGIAVSFRTSLPNVATYVGALLGVVSIVLSIAAASSAAPSAPHRVALILISLLAAVLLVVRVTRGARAASPPDGPPPSPPPPRPRVTNLPPLTPHFTGRDGLVDEVVTHLSAERRVALVGLAGVGKTQVALGVAHREAASTAVMWWIDAETTLGTASGLAALARALGSVASDHDALMQDLKVELARRSDWLVVFDNVHEPTRLVSDLPSTGRLVFTSQYPTWGEICRPVPVESFDPVASLRYLQRRLPGEHDVGALTSIADELGGLPLGLEQAASYMGQSAMTAAEYVALLEQGVEKAMALGKPLLYGATVDAAIFLSVAQLHMDHPQSILSLFAVSLLAPETIPEDVLITVISLWGGVADGSSDPTVWHGHMAALRRFSLVEPDLHGVRMHRVVQATVRSMINPDVRPVLLLALALALGRLWPTPPEDPAGWADASVLLPHGLEVADRITATVTPDDRSADAAHGQGELDEEATNLGAGLYQLCGRSSLALDADGSDELAVRAFTRCIAVRRVHGDLREVAQAEGNLGLALKRQGDWTGAQRAMRSAISGLDEVGDPMERVGARLNLALLLMRSEQRNEAKEIVDDAWELAQASFEPESAELAEVLSSIAAAADELMGDVELADGYYRRSLATLEATYGRDDWRLLITLSNYGRVLITMVDLPRTMEVAAWALHVALHNYPRDSDQVEEQVRKLELALEFFYENETIRQMAAMGPLRAQGPPRTPDPTAVDLAAEPWLRRLGDLLQECSPTERTLRCQQLVATALGAV